MSVKVVSLLLSRVVSHRLVMSGTSESTERERLGNRKMVNVYPTPSVP